MITVKDREKIRRAYYVDGKSMRQIARRAGVALGGIYNYFPSKEELFFALLEERLPAEEILDTLAGIEDSSGPEMPVAPCRPPAATPWGRTRSPRSPAWRTGWPTRSSSPSAGAWRESRPTSRPRTARPR